MPKADPPNFLDSQSWELRGGPGHTWNALITPHEVAETLHTHPLDVWCDLPEAAEDECLKRLKARLPQLIVSILLIQLHKVHDQRNDWGQISTHTLTSLTTVWVCLGEGIGVKVTRSQICLVWVRENALGFPPSSLSPHPPIFKITYYYLHAVVLFSAWNAYFRVLIYRRAKIFVCYMYIHA